MDGRKVVLSTGKATYTKYELEDMSEKRKSINDLTMNEWAIRWDSMTKKIRKKYGLKIKGE